ncbi:MAG: GNAT family N-acetyltransferase [Chloroflexi bacterium]|nr:GNAT family N-acetyltransferase [Chloroflexota bacterium]
MFALTPLARKNRRAVDDLLYTSYRVHTHLDWQTAEEWLNACESPAWLAWQGERLVGMMAAGQPVEHTCWIRLAALHDDALLAAEILRLLWERVRADLRALGVRQAALLLVRDWLKTYLAALGFQYDEHIITLFRGTHQPLPGETPPEIVIRTVGGSDMDAVLAIDHAAFPALWRLSKDDLYAARRVAAICTLAQRRQQMLGYQLCTQTRDSAHLARLAVRPEAQGTGVGAALLHDVLRRFARRNIYTMSVNTQASNLRSQKLYQRCGFVRNGYDLPVYLADL